MHFQLGHGDCFRVRCDIPLLIPGLCGGNGDRAFRYRHEFAIFHGNDTLIVRSQRNLQSGRGRGGILHYFSQRQDIQTVFPYNLLRLFHGRSLHRHRYLFVAVPYGYRGFVVACLFRRIGYGHGSRAVFPLTGFGYGGYVGRKHGVVAAAYIQLRDIAVRNSERGRRGSSELGFGHGQNLRIHFHIGSHSHPDVLHVFVPGRTYLRI